MTEVIFIRTTHNVKMCNRHVGYAWMWLAVLKHMTHFLKPDWLIHMNRTLLPDGTRTARCVRTSSLSRPESTHTNTHLKFSNSYIQMYRSRRLLAVKRRLF